MTNFIYKFLYQLKNNWLSPSPYQKQSCLQPNASLLTQRLGALTTKIWTWQSTNLESSHDIGHKCALSLQQVFQIPVNKNISERLYASPADFRTTSTQQAMYTMFHIINICTLLKYIQQLLFTLAQKTKHLISGQL